MLSGGSGFSRRKVMFLGFSSLLVMFSITGILGAKVLPRVTSDETYRFLSLFEEVLTLVRYNYVEPVDARKLMGGAYRGAAEALDPYGAYLTPEEMQQEKSAAHAAGDLGLVVSRRFGYLVVVTARELSPAFRAGIRSGDYVITVDGKSASELSVARAHEAFEGTVGSKVGISVIRRSSRTGEPEDMELTREALAPMAPVATTVDGVLHLRVRDIHSADLAPLKSELGKAPGSPVLLDLRDCATDGLDEAVAMVDLFIDDGPIVKIKDAESGESVRAATPGTDTIGAPLYLLVNRGSAGAAEIVAGAVKHHHRAIVLGERTFGRASVQRVYPLGNGGGVRVTTTIYLTPDGKTIQGSGIEPDERISEPEPTNEGPAPEGDPVLQKAIERIHGGDGAAQPKAA